MGSSKSEDMVRCYLMNRGSILSQLCLPATDPLDSRKTAFVEALLCVEFNLAFNV